MLSILYKFLFVALVSTISFAGAKTSIIPGQSHRDKGDISVEDKGDHVLFTAAGSDNYGRSYNIFDAFNLYNTSLKIANLNNANTIYIVVNSTKPSSLLNAHGIETIGHPAAISFDNPFGFFLQNLTFTSNNIKFDTVFSHIAEKTAKFASETIDALDNPITGGWWASASAEYNTKTSSSTKIMADKTTAKNINITAEEVHLEGSEYQADNIHIKAKSLNISAAANEQECSSSTVHAGGQVPLSGTTMPSASGNAHTSTSKEKIYQNSMLKAPGTMTLDIEGLAEIRGANLVIYCWKA